jgi:hypothetical protein
MQGTFPTVTVTMLGSAAAVPWFSIDADWDAGTAAVSPLVRVRATVSMAALRGAAAAWRLHSVVGEYGDPVQGLVSSPRHAERKREGEREGGSLWDLVDSHRRWKRPCLETAHMTI